MPAAVVGLLAVVVLVVILRVAVDRRTARNLAMLFGLSGLVLMLIVLRFVRGCG